MTTTKELLERLIAKQDEKRRNLKYIKESELQAVLAFDIDNMKTKLEQLRARLEQDRKELIEKVGKTFELFNDHNAMSYGNAEILQRKIVGLLQGEKKEE